MSRSQQVHLALRCITSRLVLARYARLAMRALHRPGDVISKTLTKVLKMIGEGL